MTQQEQIAYVRSRLAGITDEILARVAAGEIPAEWVQLELSEYMLLLLMRTRSEMVEKRLQKFRQTVIQRGL